MLIHQFDSETGQYIVSHMADLDPKNPDRWLVPAFSTADPLPERLPKTWPFRHKNKWILLPDYRGLVLYRQDNGEPAEILTAGTTPGEHRLTETPRPSEEHVWRDGAWEIAPERVAQRARDAAMAEFETRMSHARTMNAGKSDAYAAGLLSREDKYYFLAWSAYQLELVRVIHASDFPESAQWPDDPQPFETACGQMLAEFEARMSKAREILATKTLADGSVPPDDQSSYQAWKAYADALIREVDAHLLDRDVVWPIEPALEIAPLAPTENDESHGVMETPSAAQ